MLGCCYCIIVFSGQNMKAIGRVKSGGQIEDVCWWIFWREERRYQVEPKRKQNGCLEPSMIFRQVQGGC